MELNRNHYFMVGVVIVLLGIQFRMVQSVVLTDRAAQFMARQFDSRPPVASVGPFTSSVFSMPPATSRTLQLPRWLGWSFISVGSVLILHSLAMKKPGG